MGKYGSGVSMKAVIAMEVESVSDILARSGLSDEERQDILDTVKEMAYQWCSSNATSCAMESAAQKILTSEQFNAWNSTVVHDDMGVRDTKMKETWPFE